MTTTAQIGNFGENIAQSILKKKFGISSMNKNRTSMNHKGYDLEFEHEGQTYAVSVTARRRIESSHPGWYYPGKDRAKMNDSRHLFAIEQAKNNNIDNLYFCFIFYYQDAQTAKIYFVNYDNIKKQNFLAREFEQNWSTLKNKGLNMWAETTKPLPKEKFEELALVNIEELELFDELELKFN